MGGGGNREVDHARLDNGGPLIGIEFENTVQPIEGDDDAVFDGDGASREAGAAAPRNEGHGVLGAEADGRDDLVGGFRNDHGSRSLREYGQPVRFVGRESCPIQKKPVFREQRLQFLDERR